MRGEMKGQKDILKDQQFYYIVIYYCYYILYYYVEVVGEYCEFRFGLFVVDKVYGMLKIFVNGLV